MNEPATETKPIVLTCNVRTAEGLLDVLACCRDFNVARVVGRFQGNRFEIDRSDEIRAAWLRGLN